MITMERPVRQLGKVSLNYARMTREDAIKALGRIETYETMPDIVAKLFDDGREWEALRLWRDMLKLCHRKDSEHEHEARERRAREREQRKANEQAAKQRKMDEILARSHAISEAVDTACNLWGLFRSIMLSNERGNYAHVRMVISKYCYDHFNVSYPAIAHVLRGSTTKHATICEAVSRWDAMRNTQVVLYSNGEFRTVTLGQLYQELARTMGAKG